VGAHRSAGLDIITAIVHQGGRKEALLHALGANTDHGLRRTNADKEKAVNIALKEPYTRGLSDNQIAEICKVSQPYVSKIRHLLANNGYKLGRTRLTANGLKMNVTKIGKKKKIVTDPTPPKVEGNTALTSPPVVNGQASGEPGTTNTVPAVAPAGTDLVTAAVAPDGTDPVAPDGTDPVAPDGTDPVVPDGTDPVAPDGTDPVVPDGTDPVVPDGTDLVVPAVAPDGTDPVAPDDSGQGTGDTSQENSDLDALDPAALKLMVIELRDTTKKQEAELEAKSSEISELEQQVEYLRKELDASIKVGTGASAHLYTNSMNNNYVSFGA
jgi:hypothetical protein